MQCVSLQLIWPIKASYRHKMIAEYVHVFQVKSGALFIAEDIGVMVLDNICCNEGEDEGNRPNDGNNQNRHIARTSGRWGRVPVWCPVVAFV